MPPKKQITKNQMIETAYQMIRNEGYESLTTRKLAKELHCSTQPIYQTFSDMKELKSELITKAQESMMRFLIEQNEKTLPADLSIILAYIHYAQEEKHLFQLIFTSGGLNKKTLQTLLPKDTEINSDMMIYVNGIIMMSAYRTLEDAEEKVRDRIIHAYNLFQDN